MGGHLPVGRNAQVTVCFGDGRFATLSEVVEHYNGVKGLGLTGPAKSDRGEPTGVSAQVDDDSLRGPVPVRRRHLFLKGV